VSVIVKESPKFVLELWEFGLVWVSCVILEIVIKNVDGFDLEQLRKLCIFVDVVSEESFLDIWVGAFVSHSGPEHHQWKYSEHFEAHVEVSELVEEE
jgi:hypothetical protein